MTGLPLPRLQCETKLETQGVSIKLIGVHPILVGATEMNNQRTLIMLASFFCFVSGMAALIYELAWIRILRIDFGSTVYALSVVLAIYMAGMATGAKIFGQAADRSNSPFRLYAVIELALGLTAILTALGRDWFHEASIGLLIGVSNSYALTLCLKIALATLVLFPPTLLIGATFPVLVRAICEPLDRASNGAVGASHNAVWLYVWNTGGAALGCLVYACWLVPQWGLNVAILAAACGNMLIAGIAWLWDQTRKPTKVDGANAVVDGQTSHELSRQESPHVARPTILMAAFVGGFITLATEVIWVRMLINLFSANVVIHAAVLCGFLIGLTAAGLIASNCLVGSWNLRGLLVVVFVANGIWLLLSTFSQSPLSSILLSLHSAERLAGSTFAEICIGLIVVVTGIPASSLGLVFPLTIALGARSSATVGHDTGWLVASNTIGAVVGSLAASLFLLSRLGAIYSLVSLALVCFLCAATLIENRRRQIGFLAATLAGIAIISTRGIEHPRLWYHGGLRTAVSIDSERVRFVREDVEATIAVVESDRDLQLLSSGMIVAETTASDLWDLLLKAHLPMLLHSEPRQVAVIGLGAGISLGAVQSYDCVDRVDCFEISPAVTEAHRYFSSYNESCWKDPRLCLRRGDGRHLLEISDRCYDVVNIDPVDPPVCNQYSVDFYRVCDRQLGPSGLIVQWAPLFHLTPEHLRTIIRSFQTVFPHATLWYDGTSILLIAAKDGAPILSPTMSRERFTSEGVQDNLSLIGRPAWQLMLGTYVAGPATLKRLSTTSAPLDTDDHPTLEYSLFWSGPIGSGSHRENLELIAASWESNRSLETLLANGEVPSKLSEARSMMRELLEIRVLRASGKLDMADEQLEETRQRYELKEMDFRLLQPFLGNY